MKKHLLAFTSILLVWVSAYAQPTSFTAHGISGGGANYSPSVNPTNPQEIYSSTDMTDLYHSTNGGASWSVISAQQIVGGGGANVQFTNNNNIRYCQTADQILEVNLPVKSTDGGVTWQHITDPTNSNGSWYVIANPQSSTQLIVSDYSNLYLSTDGGATFGSAFFTDATGNGAYIAGTFFDGANIYVCTNVGLLVSTNSGSTWSGPTLNGITGEDIVSFAGAKVGGTTRFFCVTQSAGNVYVGMSGEDASSYANVYSMDYSGAATWAVKNTGITSGDWPMFIGMAPNNINDVYLGGESGSGLPIVLKTGNAGTKWNYVFNTAGNQNIKTGYCGQGGDLGWTWPQYIFGMSVCASDSLTVVVTDEGFIHKTNDGGKTWQALYVTPSEQNAANANTPKGKYYHTTGIEMTSVWDVMWYDSKHLCAGFTDVTGVRSNDGGDTWGFDCQGLYGYNTTYKFVKNPTNNVVYAATSSIHDMYWSNRLEDSQIDNGTGAIMFSTDTGKTFSTMYNFGRPVIWMSLDPTSSTRMYACVINHAASGSQGGIWVSNNIDQNASATWTHCTNPPRTEGHPMNVVVLNDGSVVATFSGRRNSAGAFTASSGVFISTDHGNSWTDITDAGLMYYTRDITIDPSDASQNTWYVCAYGGWGGAANNKGGVYRTTNRGTSWTRIVNTTNANVGDTSSCTSISFDPVNKGAAYLTTTTGGLYYTTNIGAASPVFNRVASYPFSIPTRVFFNPYKQTDVWVASFGNGLEMGSISITAINEVSSEKETAKVYPNPGSGLFTIQLQNVNDKNQLLIYNTIGEKVYDGHMNASSMQIDLNNQPNGIYLYRVLNENGSPVADGKLIKGN